MSHMVRVEPKPLFEINSNSDLHGGYFHALRSFQRQRGVNWPPIHLSSQRQELTPLSAL